jgi:putative tryptophan/tyrosine transport system substrate-binding protein
MRRRAFIARLGVAAVVSPHAARAQSRPMPVIGYLGLGTAAEYAPWVAAVQLGLGDTGYAVGQNVAMEYLWAEGNLDRIPALVADFVSRKVSVIITSGGNNGILAAKNATSTIPVLFIGGGDLVGLGIVSSLARPGGNLTGFTIMASELMPKRLELLSELVPTARTIALLVNPKSVNDWMPAVQSVARERGVQLPILLATNSGEIDTAFASLGDLHAGALLLAGDPLFNNRRAQLVALAARFAIPVMHEWRESVELGGLCSYAPSLAGLLRQVGAYAGRILSGARPADLPIQEPRKFDFVINLKTAKALGLTVPQSILVRADEVIE